MTEKQILKKFAEQITNKKWHITKSFMWYINLTDTIYYCEHEDNESAQAFRNDFISKCPCAARYSDITISILHEIGHYMTQDNMNHIYPDSYTYDEYFNIHDEVIATNWAINYLLNHKKEVENFEKQLTMIH